MKPEDIERLYRRQLDNGGPIRSFDEWQLLLPIMHESLVTRAQTVTYDQLPISYHELGNLIGLLWNPESEWWPLKMAHLLGACAEYERENMRPMLTAIVVNAQTLQPGQGFWGLDDVPAALRLNAGDQVYLEAIGRDERRDMFWIQEMTRLGAYLKGP